MAFSDEIKRHFTEGGKNYIGSLSIDCVILGFHEGELRVLLLYSKLWDKWALPGGFIKHEEHLNEAALRILHERTGLKNIFLKEFGIFSDPNRSTKALYEPVLKENGLQIENSWMFDRFVTVGYSALVDFTKAKPSPDIFSDSCEWHSLQQLPAMILDHAAIVEQALLQLRLQLNYQPIGYNLLPPKFTMPELQKLYETILGKQLDRRNFQRKILNTGILRKLDERKKGVNHKAPTLYSFNMRTYNKVLQAGMGFEL